MTVTDFLHLTKDAETDFYSVSRVNANSDRIDRFAEDAADAISILQSGKVDRENGKGLSSEDYTSAEKTKLAALENYDDTALSGRVSALEGALNPTAWEPASVHDHSAGQLDIESGGWVKIGKIALVSIRFKVKANEEPGDDHKITAGAVFQGLPHAVTTMSGTGNSCIAAANNLNMGITVTNSGTMLLLANQTIPANTRVYVSAAYLCQ